ncbi:hypothetical protein D9Q98_003234 [Chlorella vulgaris]|uniref:Uncharacterized protein n=1 Tax=Chlorella vulgaris TaxID=3077 RepID=A0A9D4TSN1_CHLVU|nr:hypothetical protein D9Q98_003234 [Chlorella vulgaris]
MSSGIAPALCVLLVCGCALGASAQLVVPTAPAQNPSKYDPCLPAPTGVNKGDPFVFGLAFWPGGTLSQWGWQYNATSGQPGLNPCLGNESTLLPTGDTPKYADYLDAYSVVFATYSVKVDTIAGVRVPRVEMDAIWRSLAASFAAGSEQVQPVISVIAFRGENRSEPQYIRSNSSQLTEGTGIVKDLSLMVSWDRGNFAGFTWYNTGPCDACGGLSSSSCVQTMYDPDFQQYTESACAWSFDECRCNDGLSCPSDNCTATVYVGHRGSDKAGRSMDSGYQIEQINKFSVTTWYWKIVDTVNDLLGNSPASTVAGSAEAQQAPVVLEGSTGADLAASQAAQQRQAGS